MQKKEGQIPHKRIVERKRILYSHLQRRKHTYLYFSVMAKKEIKLESNYETKEGRKIILNG